MERINVNDRVLHSKGEFGEGTVVNIIDDLVIVRFDHYGIKSMIPSFLKKVKQIESIEPIINEITIKKQLNEKIDTPHSKEFAIKPPNLMDLNTFTNSEKDLVKYFKKSTKIGFISLGTSPTGYIEAPDLGRLGFLADDSKGLLVFSVIGKERLLNLHNKNLLIIFLTLFEEAKKEIVKRLYESPVLFTKIGESKTLKFPFKFVLVCQEIELEQAKTLGLTSYHDGLFFKNLVNDRFNLNSIFDNVQRNFFSGFNETMKKYILQIIHPEYVTISFERKESLNNNEVVQNFIPYELDDKQLKYINSINKGHYLFLANAGTGKSVLLLSKAFRLANSDVTRHRVLITCYNNNLSQKYNDQAHYSGISRQKNLIIMTFHKLLLEIANEAGLEKFQLYTNGELDYELVEKKIREYILKNSKIKKFNAIFVDEVQLLTSEQLDLLYSLLDDSEKDNYFYLYGDLNQDVSRYKRKGTASWQNMNSITNFTGRVKYLDINYRNTYQINQYLKTFLNYMNANLKEIGAKISDKDVKFDSSTLTYGTIPMIVNQKNKNGDLDYQKIVEYIVKYRKDNDLNFDDIAVIFPYRQAKLLEYVVEENIREYLNKNNISYSFIVDSNENNRTKLNQSYGIKISTMESTLGLDFKAVFLIGLRPLEYMKTSKNKFISRKFKNPNNDFKKEDLIEYYSKNSRLLYAAASRAKEHLVIFSDLDSNSAIYDLITLGGNNDYYEESNN